MIFPNPLLISYEEWANLLANEYPSSFIPQAFDPWKDWARAVLRDSQFTPLGIPDPDQYEHWFEWAFVFYRLSLNLNPS